MDGMTKQVYENICRYLDSQNWKYERHEEDAVIRYNVTGDDLEMGFVWFVDGAHQVIRVFSQLPFKMPEDRRVEGGLAVCALNGVIINGAFDYKFSDGSICFKMAQAYMDSILGDGLYEYLLGCSIQTVDAYNDQLFMLAKGMISLKELVDKVNEI